MTDQELYIQGWKDCLDSLDEFPEAPEWGPFEESVVKRMWEDCYSD